MDDERSALEADLRQRCAALTLEEKVQLLTGADTWSVPACPRIGLRRMVLSDGPVGVRGERWDERDVSANVPSPTALAASWDVDAVGAIGQLLAEEARRKGVDVVLAPTVNLQRTPYGGRHFECFSEDPLLTGAIGAAYVRGLQESGVAATVKHFVANDSETDRFTVDVIVDERTLRELYLAPFETIVRQAGAWAVMCSYNSVNGPTMSEHPLLRDVLKDEWGFDGLVMSDWMATRSTVESARAALDLVMPGPEGPWGVKLIEAVRDGVVPVTAIDDKVLRILRLATRVGALSGVPAAGVPASGATRTGASSGVLTGASEDELAESIGRHLRAAAAAGFVLARNEGALLPLAADTLRRVAVLGPNAEQARTLGGGSATVFPPYVISPLTGLREALGPEVRVDYAIGARTATRLGVAPLDLLTVPETGDPGVRVRLLAVDGTVLRTEDRRSAQLTWNGGFGPDIDTSAVAVVEVTTRFVPQATGSYTIGCSGVGRFRLSVDGEVRFDGPLAPPPGTDEIDIFVRLPQWSTQLDLVAGTGSDIVLRYDLMPGALQAKLEFNAEPAWGDPEAELAAAVDLAAAADVAVVVVGTTEEVESEGFDRATLRLPGRQDELVRRVLAANPRTVVVVNAGAPVLVPCADQVPAVLLSWFPGQEYGRALAQVLLGDTEPGGRLPVTWPADEPDWLPAVAPERGALTYREGITVGYRLWDRVGVSPAFCFGHGLGYTTWEYCSLDVPPVVDGTLDVNLRVTLRNTGDRPGREVVQVYASRRPGAAVTAVGVGAAGVDAAGPGLVEYPARWLVGFGVVLADAGETVDVEIVLPARSFAHWDVAAEGWTTEPGVGCLAVGRSLDDIRLRANLTVIAE